MSKQQTKQVSIDPAQIDYDSAEVRATLRETVAKGATDAELAMFLMFCKTTGLNPFKREIWFIKPSPYRNKRGELVQPPVQMMTGINGYWTVANSHPQFDGADEPVWERTKEGAPIRVSIKVWRKDRKYPSFGEAWFKEYYQPGFNGNQSIWDKKPSAMLLKVAESIAIRKGFTQELGNTYTEEEMGAEYSASAQSVDAVEPVDPSKAGPFDTEPDMTGTTPYVHYDISGLAEQSKAGAQRYLEREQAYFDEELGVWVAPRRLAKLTSCIVKAGVAQPKPPPQIEHTERATIETSSVPLTTADRLQSIKDRAAQRINHEMEVE